MASARRISGSASPSRLVAWSNGARLLRSLATSGWSGPKLSRRWPAPAASAARPRPAGSWPGATRQIVEVSGDVGMLRPEGPFRRWPAPGASSGSASPSRFVAWSNCARLLRSLATSGCSGPKLFSSMASARRIKRLGLAQPVGGLEQLRQIVEVGGDVGVLRPEATFRRWPAPGASSGSASPSRFVAWSNDARLLRSVATLGCSGPKLLLVDGQRPPHQAARPRPAGSWPGATAPDC